MVLAGSDGPARALNGPTSITIAPSSPLVLVMLVADTVDAAIDRHGGEPTTPLTASGSSA